MRAIIAEQFAQPTEYQLADVPPPTVEEPTDVIIQVHAASVNPVDVKLASGVFKAALPESFPLRIGYDCAGVITEIGSGVTKLKVGDEVYSRLPEVSKGSWGEYVRCAENYVSHKPPSLPFVEAASLPLAALTALQALKKYEGSLAGKTVFVPAGLGGTGAFALQLAKNYFKAGKVITTVSTAKVDKVPQYLGPNVVDQIIDYSREDVFEAIPRGSVDFVLDTLGQAVDLLPLMKPSTGHIVSISTTPSGSQLQNASFFQRPGKPVVPWYARYFLDGSDAVRKLRARRWAVKYEYMFLKSDAKGLEQLSALVEAGKLRPVVGSVVPLSDVEKVRTACQQVYEGKGGLGKTVIEILQD